MTLVSLLQSPDAVANLIVILQDQQSCNAAQRSLRVAQSAETTRLAHQLRSGTTAVRTNRRQMRSEVFSSANSSPPTQVSTSNTDAATPAAHRQCVQYESGTLSLTKHALDVLHTHICTFRTPRMRTGSSAQLSAAELKA